MALTEKELKVLGSITGILGNTASNLDTEQLTKDIDIYTENPQPYSDFDLLSNSFSLNSNKYGQQDFWNSNHLKSAANMFKESTMGAVSGLSAGPVGALVGAGIGLGSGIYKWVKGALDSKNKAIDANKEIDYNNKMAIANVQNNANNISNNIFNKAVMGIKKKNGGPIDTYDWYKVSTYYPFTPSTKRIEYKGIGNINAFGGNLDLSGDWSNGVKIVTEGGTHEENKYGGVPMGVDNNGIPNLVEEGEVVYNDYVFSNRLSPTKNQLFNIKLPTKYEGKTFAEIAKDIQKGASEMPNDPIAKNTMTDGLGKLMAIQEEIRQTKENKNSNKFPNGGELLRFAPVATSASQVLSDAFGLTNKYDYSNADILKHGLDGIKNVTYTPISEHIDYTPLDESYLSNKLLNNGLATQRAITNSAPNSGAATASLLALNNQLAQQLGDSYIKAKQYNDDNRNKASQFNLGIQQYNSQLQAQNAQLNRQLALQKYQGLSQYAQFRDQIDSAISAARSSNINNLTQNISNVGTEYSNYNLALDYLKAKGLQDEFNTYINGKFNDGKNK